MGFIVDVAGLATRYSDRLHFKLPDSCSSSAAFVIVSSRRGDPVQEMTTVEYNKSSAEANMDINDSKISYRQLLDGTKLRYSVSMVRNNPFRAAAGVLLLLSVLLLAVTIGQGVHYSRKEQEHQKNLTAVNKDRDELQQNLKTLRRQKGDLEALRDQLQVTNGFLSKKKDQIQVNNNLLTVQKDTLKRSEKQLQASNTALNLQLEQMKATRYQLQTSVDSMAAAKGKLEQRYTSVLKTKNELQASYVAATKERDNFHNKFNNASRSREQLQASYNTLIRDVEHLQDRYNSSSSEKDRIASSHRNLTREQQALRATYDLLVKATDELRAEYNSSVQGKRELESSCRNTTEERDELKTKNGQLAAERDQLQLDNQRLNETIQQHTMCPSGWKKYQSRCFYVSTQKDTWRQSRDFCKKFGGDLAIIKTREDMNYVENLYGYGSDVWIGLTDTVVEGQWRWVDGSSLTTKFWGQGQPNSYNGNQDCVEITTRSSGTSYWNDETCSEAEHWLCEKSL